jgi:preprotein translocase subunit SecG
MSTLLVVVMVVQVLAALAIIGLVLLQHGKGADMGAAFGSGASGSLFGATGSSNFLSKSTGVAATIFFATTLMLAFLGNKHETVGKGVMDKLPVAPASGSVSASVPSVPANPANGVAASTSVKAPAVSEGQSNQIPK